MRYAVFSGPEGEVTNFEGLFDTTKEADIQVEGGEDNSGLFYKIVDLELGTVYTSEGALPEGELSPDRDYILKADGGDGVWITVETPWGKKVVKVGVDLPTGACQLRTFEPGAEDENPNNEILEPFE